jgi:Domain of unknown function (DUF1735)
MSKKILKVMGLLAIVIAVSSCLKDEGYENQQYGTSLSGTPVSSLRSVKIVEGGIDGGDIRRSLLAFANPSAALDSMTFTVAYFDNTSTLPKAPATITVTLGIDPAFITTYNASQAIQYERMPDSLFTIPTLTTTIPAGQQFSAPIKVYFKPNKFNPAKIYMLPIRILSTTGVDGVTVQANYGVIVYSIIGNILSGKYSWRYRRWQSGDTTTAPLQDVIQTVNLSSVTPSALMTREEYTTTFIDPNGGIVLNFTESGGIPGNFNLSLLPSTVAGIPAGGFLLLDGPKFATGGNPVVVGTGATNFIGTRFSTYIQYQNSTPATRTLVNSFTKIP